MNARLKLLQGDHVLSTLPYPKIYKAKIARISNGKAEFVWYIGPLYDIPKDWHLTMRRASKA